ncbi:MAG: lipase family protein [Deltaproteobacteria bacterium]|nr:lipase family protein [Deltaproteobacteria bacterium]
MAPKSHRAADGFETSDERRQIVERLDVAGSSAMASPVKVQRSARDEAEIRRVLSTHGRREGHDGASPRLPEEIRTREVKRLLETIDPQALTVSERVKLLSAVLDDRVVSARDLPDFGLFSDNEQGLAVRLLETAPAQQRTALAGALLESRLLDTLYRRVDEPALSGRIDQAMAGSIVEASAQLDARNSVGEVSSTSREEGTQRSRADQAVSRASRHIARDLFPLGAPYTGMSYRARSGAAEKPGEVELLLHRREGAPLSLGPLNLRRFETSELVFKAMLDRFNVSYFGTTGREVNGCPWLALASDLVPDDAASKDHPGAKLRDLVAWSGTYDRETQKVRFERSFQLPLAGAAKLLGLPAGTDGSALLEGVEDRLERLGAKNDEAALVERGGEPRLALSAQQAELLLKSRSFTELGRRILPDGQWEFVREIGGEPRFVIPAEACARFDRLELPEGKNDPAAVQAALRARLSAFGLGSSVEPLDVAGRKAFAIPLEQAQVLLETSRFDLRPEAGPVDSDNLYWSARFSQLAYESFDPPQAELRQKLARLGFKEFETISKDGAEALVASNGKVVMVACRGTMGASDVLKDLQALREETTPDGLARRKQQLVRDGTIGNLELSGRKLMVHQGFAGQALGVLDEVQAAVGRLGHDGELPLWVTGHSKGGAEASLLAVALELNGVHVAGGCGIESPRVGDKEFVALAKDLGLADHWAQLMMSRDIVPHVPSRGMGFEHLGTILVADDRTLAPDWGLDAMERSKALFLEGLVSGEAIEAHRVANVLDNLERGALDVQWSAPAE